VSVWFQFGKQNHLQLDADPQRAGCGTRPLEPQPTFTSEEPPQFACRACLVAWLDEVLEEEAIEDAISRGYTEARFED
jgi:hypothetical protein